MIWNEYDLPIGKSVKMAKETIVRIEQMKALNATKYPEQDNETNSNGNYIWQQYAQKRVPY